MLLKVIQTKSNNRTRRVLVFIDDKYINDLIDLAQEKSNNGDGAAQQWPLTVVVK